MARTIAVEELRENCDQLLRDVERLGEELWIARGGQVVARVVPLASPDDVLSEEGFDALIRRVHQRNADVPAEVLEADIAEAFEAVRSGRWPIPNQ